METKIIANGCQVLFDLFDVEKAPIKAQLSGMSQGASYAIQLALRPNQMAREILACNSEENAIFSVSIVAANPEGPRQLLFTFYTASEEQSFMLEAQIDQTE